MQLGTHRHTSIRSAKYLIGCVLAWGATGAAAGDFDIDLAQIQELSPPPGTVIAAAGLDQYKQVLDPDLADLIAQGWYTITVGEPLSFDPHPNFVAATQQNIGKAQLGDNGTEIVNYVAGRSGFKIIAGANGSAVDVLPPERKFLCSAIEPGCNSGRTPSK